MKELQFSVDAALLRELGERLVGRPHIALAELIKNSYDADARNVVLRFDEDSIEIVDDGHGMTFAEFRDFWMRIGTPHKQSKGRSPELHRPLTGSKGVGRLSVQFLGGRIDVATVSTRDAEQELNANVDWDEAVTAGELTSAKARYSEGPPSRSFANDSPHGTSILLRRLRHPWLPGNVADVAREIRDLQPPFRPNPRTEGNRASSFNVEVVATDERAESAFKDEMRAYLDNWYARITGRLRPRPDTSSAADVDLSILFADQSSVNLTYQIADASIRAAEFEVRVFYLVNRQGRGVKVVAAREYLKRFGGIHIYDAGFHLPYYGPDTDWLNIERDHAQRVAVSQLLPSSLQIRDGLTFLPSQARLFGVVHVDTGFEREAGKNAQEATTDVLTLQMTRDRLVDNAAFRGLRDTVRWALDYYAMQEAKRTLNTAERQRSTEASRAVGDHLSAIARVKSKIEPGAYAGLVRDFHAIETSRRVEMDVTRLRQGLLAALATAGIAALAYDHELGKQLNAISRFADRIEDLLRSGKPSAPVLTQLAAGLRRWEERARGIRALFANVADESNRQTIQRLNVKAVLLEIRNQVKPLLRGITLDLSNVDGALTLPEGTYAEWSALFQNLLTNALNAVMDETDRRIVVRTVIEGRARSIVVEDTGRGVDLRNAERLFEPFERGAKISRERRALGLGGTGLGLTIVRMIASNRHSEVQFIAPSTDFRTAIALKWSEAT